MPAFDSRPGANRMDTDAPDAVTSWSDVIRPWRPIDSQGILT
jgi:hypothetical protein